jgi:type IV secretory pathway VirB10-like protein
MRKSICLIVLALLAAPVAAQPGQTPVMPPGPQPMPPDAPYPEQQPPPDAPYPEQQQPPDAPYPEQQQQQPPPMQQQPPTRASFVSTGMARWDVRIDNNAVCSTPCSTLIDPMRFITLHSQERNSERLAVGYLPPGDVLVQAKPRAQGAFAAGVTFTSLSGMGLATGITLTAVGCATDRGTMCKAGLITGVARGFGLYFSIDLILRSLPRVYVGPAQATPYATRDTVGVAGRF